MRPLLLALATAFSACSDAPSDPLPEPTGTWYRPSTSATFQIQLSGTPRLDATADVYVLDLFDTPASTIAALQQNGRRVVCYFSAGSFEDWRPDTTAFPHPVRGRPLDDWPGERWLDLRSPEVRTAHRARLDLAVQKGCDGVDPDNVDGYGFDTNADPDDDTGFGLRMSDSRAFLVAFAADAHARGLAVGLKNATELIPTLSTTVDFAVNEECVRYEECSVYAPLVAAGRPVFHIEYADTEAAARAAATRVCAVTRSLGMRTLLMPPLLDGRFRVPCPP